MLKFAGLTFTVRKGWENGSKARNLYKLDEIGFTWDEEWLAPVKNIEINEEDILGIM
jgi:ubiquinone biosynthesis protein Coq4